MNFQPKGCCKKTTAALFRAAATTRRANMTQTETDQSLIVAEPQAVERGDVDGVRASWNISADTIRQNTAHFAPDEAESLISLFRWCTDPRHPMRREVAAARLECSGQLIYQLLAGIYRNPDKSLKRPSKEFMERLRTFLSLEAKKYAAAGSDFIITPTSKKISTAFELARESHSPVILSGPSQIGKTWTLRHLQANNNHGRTIMVELEAACGLGGLIRTCAEASGVSPASNTPALIQRLKKAWTPDTVVILDEMHLLKHTYRKNSFFACIEVIRRLWDYTQCGMILSWTNLDELKNASQGELVQIWRRGVHRVALPLMPTKGDLSAILHHHGLEFPDRKLEVTVGKVVEQPYEILRQQAKTNGLKAITERIRYAHKLADKSNGKLAWTHFVDAHLRIVKQAEAEGEWS
jgi:DNA transposition AAA+ family ATPase